MKTQLNSSKLFLISFSLIFIILISCKLKEKVKDNIHPQNLKCELMINPLGVDVSQPRLSWELISKQRGQIQTAYQIIVSSTKEKLNEEEGDLWNSKKIISDKSINVKYNGNPLRSNQQCFWKVKVWDIMGKESEWSENVTWSMGILNIEEWKAKWIGIDKAVGNDEPNAEKTKLSARYLRKEFSTVKEIKRATAFICGLGTSELYINGEKISDNVLSPAASQFNKRVFYVTHDVTNNINKGKNTLGVILGNGRFFPMRQKEPFTMEGYGYPKLLLQMEVEFVDGTKEIILSDESWKITTEGPITENNEYDGEKYDARKEMKNWNLANFDDSAWRKVDLVKNPSEIISSQMMDPIKINESIKPIKVIESKPNMFVFDMGQNMVGWVKLKVNAKKGTKIKLRFSETLKEDGTLYLDNLRSADVTDIYICKGEGEEIWEPRFTYHGFRFVELSGFPGTPDLSTIEGKVINDDVSLIGNFECSNEEINKLYRNAVWGIRGNYRSFPTDCPQRDERMPWLGDRATGSRGESYIFDISKLYSKWIQDIGDAQLETGSISDVSPSYWKIYNDNVTWAGTPIILANMLYEQYGDEEVIKKSYPYMKKWYNYMVEKYMTDGLMPRDNYGDWCVPPSEPEIIHSNDPKRITSGVVLGTAFFNYMSKLMKGYAEMLRNTEDADFFNKQFENTKNAFNNSFLNKNFGTYSNNTATANLLPLVFNIVPEEFREKTFYNIIEKIEVQHKGHIPVGLIGAQFIMRTLTDMGRGDIAYRFATQKDYPSWGYMIENDATTIWELWNGNTADPAMNSGNHVMLLGDLNIWLYEDLAAIKPAKAGFKEITMKPLLVEGLNNVNASHESPYGLIKSNWNINGNKFYWTIAIPVNSKALVYIPTSSEKNVKEIGGRISQSDCIKFLKYENNFAIYEVLSGNYNFISTDYTMMKSTGDRVAVPEININKKVSTAPVYLSITCQPEGTELRYTLNGTDPTEKSFLFTNEIEIDKTSIIKAKGFKKDLSPSFICTEKIDIFNPDVNGLNYSYYEGEWKKLPNFSKLTPKKIDKVSDIEDLQSLKMREDYWGIVFEGFIEMPKDDDYIFSTSSDDGSRLFIDDKMIIDNDGVHGVTDKQGEAKLKAGKHKIRIEFFEGNYGEILHITYSSPTIPLQRVSCSMLYYN